MNAAAGAIAAASVIALAAPLTGCASGPYAGAAARATESDTPAAPTSALTGALAQSQSHVGLEIQWWTVTDRPDALAHALAPYANEPTPLSASVRANWRRNGMRMVRVPVEDMAALLESLPIEDKVNRVWLGQIPAWTVAAPGAPWDGERSLRIDNETIRLGAGRLRLLVRAWISPTEGPPTLRTDLSLQYLGLSMSASSSAPFEPASLRRPELEGMIFHSLTASMELSDGFAYCILSEDPEIDWASMRLGKDDAEQRDGRGPGDRGEDAPAHGAPALPERAPALFPEPEEYNETRALGPKPPGIPLLADALFSRVELLPTRRRARSIVILAPTVPDEFRLRPPAAFNTPR